MNGEFKGIVISGPTGVGKTDISIILAKILKADIISSDASQIYREMDIGTAKVTYDEMDGIRHHMIDIVDPGEDYSVGNFESDVNKILKNKKGENTIIVGGTGLYIKSVTDGFSVLPSRDEKIRETLKTKDIEELQGILKKLDRKTHEEIDLNNRIRLVRAIEVCLLTGKKFSELKKENKKDNDYRFLKIFLIRNREELYNRIDKRVDIMFSQGLEEEAKNIYEKYRSRAHRISAIGYKELFCYFNGDYTLEEAKEKIKRESRRYAKRQMTWFRKEKEYITYNLSEVTEKKVIEKILKEWESF